MARRDLNRFFKIAKTKTEIVKRHWLNLSVEIHFKAIKSIRMKVNTIDGSIRISAPRHIPESTVFEFMQQNYDWIEKRKMALSKSAQFNFQYQDGEQHPLWGKPHQLSVALREGRASIALSSELAIIMRIPPTYERNQKIKLLDNLYRKQLKLVIPELLEKWQPIVGKTANEWGVKKMQTRWGTCNINAKRIWLSLELAKRPQECLEYVVVHELVHLHERHHNKRFYGLMTQFMPNWKEHEEKLKSPLT